MKNIKRKSPNHLEYSWKDKLPKDVHPLYFRYKHLEAREEHERISKNLDYFRSLRVDHIGDPNTQLIIDIFIEEAEEELRQARRAINRWYYRIHPEEAPANKYDLEALKAIPLTEVITIEPVRTTQQRTLYYCPFHTEKSASFYVFANKNNYHCFGCGEHGSVIDYVMKINNVSFLEACKILST